MNVFAEIEPVWVCEKGHTISLVASTQPISDYKATKGNEPALEQQGSSSSLVKDFDHKRGEGK